MIPLEGCKSSFFSPSGVTTCAAVRLEGHREGLVALHTVDGCVVGLEKSLGSVPTGLIPDKSPTH